MAMLCLLHAISDCFSSFVVTLQLVLALTFALDKVEAGLLATIGLIGSNLAQPVFGWISDRWNGRWLIIVGPALSAVCLGMLGLSPWLGLTVALIFVGMLGVAMFHPEAATLAARFGAAGSARMMALFMAAGYAGHAAGPWIISTAVSAPGRTFADSWITSLLAIPALLFGLLLIRRLPQAESARDTGPRQRFTALLRGRHRAIWLLIAAQTTRLLALNVVLNAIAHFLEERGRDQQAVGRWMAVYIAAQALGILVGGATSPRYHERTALMASLAAVLVPLWILPWAPAGIALTVIAVTGIAIGWTIPVAVRLGQDIVPGGRRWISGMMMGLTWGTAGLIAPPLVGWLSREWSSHTALIAAGVIGVVALGCAVALPGQARLNDLRGGER